MIKIIWISFWEMICTPYLLFRGAVIEFPKKRSRAVNVISIISEALAYCFQHVEGADSNEQNQKRFAFLPEKTKDSYKKAEEILEGYPFSYRVEGRDLHLLLSEEAGEPFPEEVWAELGELLDRAGGKYFRTNIRNGMVIYYIHEMVFPQQKGEAEQKIVVLPSTWNKRIDSILFLCICAGFYAVYDRTESLIITALSIIAFSSIRRAFFYRIIGHVQGWIDNYRGQQ